LNRRIWLLKKVVLLVTVSLLLGSAVMPVQASPASATRSLPLSVESGSKFDVTLHPEGCGFAGQVIETMPEGFVYIECLTPDIGVEVSGNEVKFTFLGSDSITYRVEAPEVAVTTAYTFHGIVKDENKDEYSIPDNDIDVSAPGGANCTMTIVVQGNGSTSPSPGAYTHVLGDVISIIAVADEGWEFEGWSGGVTDPYSSSTTVTMNSSKKITARFSSVSAVACDLTVSCEPGNGGELLLHPAGDDNQYEAGSSVELVAIAAEGYVFSCWSGDLSGSINPVNLVMDCDKRLIANFVPTVSEKAAKFVVSSLNIYPERVRPGQRVDISVLVTNGGDSAGDHQISLDINGDEVGTRMVEVPAKTSRKVVFSVTRTTPGTYSVLMNGYQGDFVVEGSHDTAGKMDVVTMGAIAIIAALILALAFLFHKIRRKA
jgi:hypothetical protein